MTTGLGDKLKNLTPFKAINAAKPIIFKENPNKPHQAAQSNKTRDVYETASTAFAQRAPQTPMSEAVPLRSPNDELKGRKYNQFLPEELGNRNAAHAFIENSNNEAYQKDIDKLENQIVAVDKFIAIAERFNRFPFLATLPVSVDELREKKEALLNEKAELISKRDTQTADAKVQFDKYYDAAKANNPDADEASLVKEASEKYNEWIFYKESEGTQLTSPTALFVTGEGDDWPIEMNDIKQGQLGDCSLMAALAAIAKNQPELIEKMIRDNGDGTYTVTFHREVPDDSFWGGVLGRTKNEPFEVTVDLTIPSNGAHCQLPGDTNAEGAEEVWPLVLEKAYAQHLGSYGAMDGLNPADVLYLLTGKDSPRVSTSDISMSEMEKNLADKRPMVMDTCNGDEELMKEYELVGNHAYAVKDVKTDADGNKYLILYNPWGGINDHPKPIPFEDVSKVLPYFCMS